ncbi:hypothetical protein [uncultured Erwinia sp.]|uniref:hypothetical protein n=1 Tax=uncultured Erwinia sp. TaxID=246798 RepID=UPI0025899CE7|nr:hypothetical protein [uncultured Erwinia sp.]
MNNSAPQLHIKVTGDAYILQNETGTAVYTKEGVGMFKINGHGLPDNIEVHGQSSKSECSEGTFHIKDGQVFIKKYALNGLRTISSISEALNAPVEENQKAEDKIRGIVSKYLTDEASEFEDELVDELKTLLLQDQQASDAARLAELVSSAISERIRKELLPGGLLYSR